MAAPVNSPEPGRPFRGPIAYMARNSIAANLMMIILVAGGVWMTGHMQKEVR